MPVMYEKMMSTKMEPIDLGATTMSSLPTHHAHHPQHHHNIQMIAHHHVPTTMQPLSQLGMQHHHHHHSANSSPNPQQMGSVIAHQDENSPISMISSQVNCGKIHRPLFYIPGRSNTYKIV